MVSPSFEHPTRVPLPVKGVASNVALFQAKLNVLHALNVGGLRSKSGLKLPSPQIFGTHARDLERVQAKDSTAVSLSHSLPLPTRTQPSL